MSFGEGLARGFFNCSFADDGESLLQIRNNDTSLMERLDGIRKKRHKHICLNDNLHHNDPDTPRVKKIVLDFYRSILPLRCAFELDPQPLRTEGLAVWTAVVSARSVERARAAPS